MPKTAHFDTFDGVGVGRLDGVPGATVTFTFKDAGEPSVNDSNHIIIEDSSGVVIDVEGIMLRGNNQAH